MIIKKLCFITFLFFGINANSSVLIETNTQNFENTADDCSLNWVYKLENYEKEVILDFFERIFNSLIKNDAIGVVDNFSDFVIKRINFIHTISEDDEIKEQSNNTVKYLLNLVKLADTQKISSVLRNVLSDFNRCNEDNVTDYNDSKFPSEMKENLTEFFIKIGFVPYRRITSYMKRHDLISVYEYFARKKNEYKNTISLDHENPKDDEKAFLAWESVLERLVRTLNPDNQPKILELFNL